MFVKITFSPPHHTVVCLEGSQMNKRLGTVRTALLKDCQVEIAGNTVAVTGELLETREGNFQIQAVSRSMLWIPEGSPISWTGVEGVTNPDGELQLDYDRLLIVDDIKTVVDVSE